VVDDLKEHIYPMPCSAWARTRRWSAASAPI